MTLLLREVVRFVAEASIWILAMATVTVASAAAVLYLAERRIAVRDLALGLLAGVALAALAHRFGVSVLSPDVAGRPLPVLWAVVGASALAVTLVVQRRRARS